MDGSTTWQPNVCFTTLALGTEYSQAALLLVRDLASHCKGIRVVVLTDRPSVFEQEMNVDLIRFRSVSPVGCYHDKRYCISEALRRYAYCCFLDADCRVRGLPPRDFWQSAIGGIVAWNVEEFLPRFEKEKNGELARGVRRFNSCDRRLALSRSIAAKLNVDLRETKFLSEVCMCFSRLTPDLPRFLALWDRYATYMQLRAYGWGEGETIGIVAQKLGWHVRNHDPSDWLFKDVLTPETVADDETLKFRQERRNLERFASKRSAIRRLAQRAVLVIRFFLASNDRHLLTSNDPLF